MQFLLNRCPIFAAITCRHCGSLFRLSQCRTSGCLQSETLHMLRVVACECITLTVVGAMDWWGDRGRCGWVSEVSGGATRK